LTLWKQRSVRSAKPQLV